MRVLLLGGGGFIGRHLAAQLCDAGVEVRIPTRDRERAKAALILLPTVDLQVADLHDAAQLDGLLDGVQAVVNLVGVLHDDRGAFQRAHVDLPRHLVEACRRRGVKRLVHLSALGASVAGHSRYLRSKGEGERIIGEAADLCTTIFRPSVVFGEGDRFLSLFASMARSFPIIPLAGAQVRFQPVYVRDVARAICASLGLSASCGQRYDLCGPSQYTLAELVRYAARQADRDPCILALPAPLARLQAMVMEHLPGRLLTRDNLDSMRIDNVSSTPFPALFGFRPTALEAVAPGYLGQDSPRARYQQYRARR